MIIEKGGHIIRCVLLIKIYIMKYVSILIIILLFSHGCYKDHQCGERIDDCSLKNLVVCDSGSVDLRKYTTRGNGYPVGFAHAIKEVPDAGEIEWMANCLGARFDGSNFYISFSNYSDTAWVGLEPWAYFRENILIKFSLDINQKQILFPESEFLIDSTLNYGRYNKNQDDFTLVNWQLDTTYESYLIITHYDSSSDLVKGVFDFSFVKLRDNSSPDESYSDHIRFRCGRFEGAFQ